MVGASMRDALASVFELKPQKRSIEAQADFRVMPATGEDACSMRADFASAGADIGLALQDWSKQDA